MIPNDSIKNLCLDRGLFIDIEAAPGGQIFALGACQGDVFRREVNGPKAVAHLIAELRVWVAKAEFVAGHNLITHDLPFLDAAFAIPEFRKIAAIDTLYLSPLAFPRNPYHRLIKNDRLSESSKNHPASDCDSSKILLQDALSALRDASVHSAQRDRLSLTRWLTSRAAFPWNGSMGFELIFSAIGISSPNDSDAETLWMSGVAGYCCPVAAQAEWLRPLTTSTQFASLAYVLAWLPVAGGGSVVPAWVRNRFPEVKEVVHRLRCTPCRDAKCPWCSEVQDPVRQVQRFFNYNGYRKEPSVPDAPGVSLQEEIVRLGMAGQSLLAILPTGGGKSLCFQIPALQRYYTSGALTIVVSPLQALMRDQVEGLIEKTNVTCAAALYGMQTPPEKAQVREEIRLGGIGIIYVSPEQLRNSSFEKVILQREIGCWVFDEAHCLSQWGHDFRPDYAYVSRFIRELAKKQGVPIPPVTCVTATAKEDVKEEILAHFQQQLGLELRLLDGGTARDNLQYRIEKIGKDEKYTRIHALLQEKIGSGIGAAVVFCATRNRAKDTATFLASPTQGWSCEAFHAGLDSEVKKRILDQFLGGKIQVVVATNAFGMGIDKEDIRLVIHADTPGSLENYLQEAGRAGRDRNPAECVLLYNDEDLETQFGLLSLAKIEKRDIDQIWRVIRKADQGDGRPVALTVSEILNGPAEESQVSFAEEEENQRGTKVRTALAVLEKQGFLERDENQTRVFQVRPLVSTEEEAIRKIGRLDLSDANQALWLDVLRLLLSDEVEPLTSLEPFVELPRMQEVYRQLRARSDRRISPFAPVIQVLNAMARPEVGLISKDVLFSARLQAGKNKKAATRLSQLVQREKDLIEALRDAEPSPEGWLPLSIRTANEHLISKGHRSQPNELIHALETLAADGRKIGRPTGLLEIGYRQNDSFKLRLSATWMEVMELSELRVNACAVLIFLLLAKAVEKSAAEEATVLVDFSETEALDCLRSDCTLNLALVSDLPAYLQYLLVYLHDNDIIELKNGKALITQAMNLRVLEQAKGNKYRRFTKGDYAALTVYYAEKIFQIHVMGEYVRVGVDRLGAHLRLISAYFQMGKAAFAARFLQGDPDVYRRATGIDSFRKIVEDLQNPIQQAIVAESGDSNLLILAGPGSGKTRVVAHRCAYLLRVERVRPERILVACFNRHAALQLRRQIYRLVERDCFGVMIQTYYGLALRLTGRSLAGAANGEDVPDFGKILEDATALLNGTQPSDGVRGDEARDQIMAGFSHILVDEYQDIDEREYAFISAIAGRREVDEDRRLSIMAVGDDDQSIYGFKGANVEFIRRFQKDYQAQEHYLTENYRSTKVIIDVANRLIGRNTDRMKVAHPIRINRARSSDAPGGVWEARDLVLKGRVQRAQVRDSLHQAIFIVDEIQRLRILEPTSSVSDFAVLARTREELMVVRAVLDARGFPVDWRAEDEVTVSPFKIREIHAWLSYLEENRHLLWTAEQAKVELLSLRGKLRANRWWTLVEDIWSEWAGNIGDFAVPVFSIRDEFAEAIIERRRANRTGKGVVLSTAHKAKGLEFQHVFIADGGWKPDINRAAMEEERRTYYVAMTRARNTLTLLCRHDCKNPFPGELAGTHIVDRAVRGEVHGTDQEELRFRRYATLTPTDIFIGFAGNSPESSPMRSVLKQIQVDDLVFLVARGRRIQIESESGVPIGQLSEAGTKRWESRLGSIISARLIALVHRRSDEGENETVSETPVCRWEYPLVEVCWNVQ